MATEEQRAYNREKQREWRRNHPEYKERAKARAKQRVTEMTEAELQHHRAIHNAQNKKWAAKNRDLTSRYTMESLARRFNCVIVPNTPEVQAALESVNEECKQIVQEARARQLKTAIDNFNDTITTAAPPLKQAAGIVSDVQDQISKTINSMDDCAFEPPAEIDDKTIATEVLLADIFTAFTDAIVDNELCTLTIVTGNEGA